MGEGEGVGVRGNGKRGGDRKGGRGETEDVLICKDPLVWCLLDVADWREPSLQAMAWCALLTDDIVLDTRYKNYH